MKKHRLRYYIKNNYHLNLKYKIYPILWCFILLASVYLLVRFAALSFSEEMGQADLNYKDTILYYASNKVLESGSSLVSYTINSEEETYFPIDLFADGFALHHFIEDKSTVLIKAQEFSANRYERKSKDEDLEETINDKGNTYAAVMENNNYARNNGIGEENTGHYQSNRLYSNIGIDLHDIMDGILSKEYILTNGEIYDAQAANYFKDTIAINHSNADQLEIGSLQGNVEVHEYENDENIVAIEASNTGGIVEYTLEQMKDINFLIRNFYIVDPSTKVMEGLFDAEELLGKDMTIKQGKDAPQILIYHTHSQETFIDSREKEAADTVVGVGSFLTQILEDRYGYQVIHDTTCYDIIDGLLDRSEAYNIAEEGIQKILDENPTIEVVIDLHRDGGDKRSIMLDGEETAQIMLFNGLSRDQNGPITYLNNPYQQDNLAFSLQLQLKSMELYPGLFYKNYLKCYRFNMHVRPKCILMELGTDFNTLQSAKNAMEPFAEILDSVLQGEGD